MCILRKRLHCNYVKLLTGGGGRKARALGVRKMLFQWFVDVKTSYKARLP